ncbi:helix-turn-helix domain-containing protein [Massilia sp. G4R7]|uniref:Helix-turn-helix domain-containing protein n=1 Tax=Massilia phyllostachyos TaxID=2898585 RepID=A0ABS8Q4R2_9BURK|nr:helix-turn-helix transcriptional regulator [Massilia phyllostachyos]MCD2516730.1 helix-turn-helix domain-containing protein [Massilia phyllostachyos]
MLSILVLAYRSQDMCSRDVNFGSELFALRRLKGITQADVASRAGLGRGYYSQLENSKKGPPSPRLLRQIAAALELDAEQTRRLLAVAVADRCAAACESTTASTPVAMLVKSLVQAASLITTEKAARIEAILLED